MQHNFIDMTNQRYGILLVVAYSETKHNRSLWKCLCDCGKKVVRDGYQLRAGTTTSCGCLRRSLLDPSIEIQGATSSTTRREYDKLHYWIRTTLGRATYCSNDPSHQSRRFDWANISGQYKRELADFQPLCRSCHIKADMTAERRQKLSRTSTLNAQRKAVLQISLQGDLIKTWPSIVSAARAIEISHTAICHVLKGKTLTAGGFKWAYARQTTYRASKEAKQAERYEQSSF